MGFQFHASNKMEALAEILCQDLRPGALAADQLFARNLVVTSSQGVRQWLRFRIAEHNAICTNVEFLLLQTFASNYLFAPLAGEAPGVDRDEVMQRQAVAISPKTLAWRIYQELESSGANYRELQEFIAGNGDPADQALRRFALSTQIADLFDQYAAYRPDEVLKWEQNADQEAWDARLWRQLFADGRFFHAARRCQQFLEAMKDPRQAREIAKTLPRQRVFFFGFSSMPPIYFVAIQALAECPGLEVHFYYLSPCNDYWTENRSPKQALRTLMGAGLLDTERYYRPTSPADDATLQAGNPLLGSLGRIGREFTKVALDYNADTSDSENRDLDDAENGTLLQRLQHDILTNRPCAQASQKTDRPREFADDDSITIHCCHSPRREVEVLYEYLLKAFAELREPSPDPDEDERPLLPCDIIVMVADLAAYAPYIHAVFGGGQGPRPRIPYSIADRSEKDEHSEVQAFLQLLNIGKTRMSSEDLLEILEAPAVRRRFGISDDDYSTLLPLLREAGASWGIDKEFRKRQMGGNGFHEYSWRFAFERLMLGYAMMAGDVPAEGLFKAGSLVSAPLPRGSQAGRIVAAFMEFAERVFEIPARLQPGDGWDACLAGILEDFFDDDDEFAKGRQAIRQAIDSLRQHLEASGLPVQRIPAAVIQEWMDKHLQTNAVGGKFLAGGVTFCKFQPMRGVPSKVIAMIGLNDGVFPRQDVTLSFSRLGSQRRCCDRSLKDDDRYAFLEALLAARKRLHLSYVGKDAMDNKETPPSIVLGEFLDYLRSRFPASPAEPKTGKPWVAEHPMHPFSPRYFTQPPAPGLVSYSQTDLEICRTMLAGPAAPAAESLAEAVAPEPGTMIDAEVLVKFFESPCKAWFNHLNIRPDLSQESLPAAVERFELNGLERWQVTQLIQTAAAAETPPDLTAWRDSLYCLAKARALLPIEPEGRRIFDECFDEVARLEKVPDGWIPQEISSQSVVIATAAGDQVVLSFTGVNLYQDEAGAFYLLAGRNTQDKARHFLRDRILHLAWNVVQDGEVTTRRQYKDDDQLKASEFRPVNAETAQQQLASLVEIYLLGQTQPLCFWLPAIQEAIKERDDNWWEAARRKWEPSEYGNNRDCADKATVNCFGREMPAADTPAGQQFGSFVEQLTPVFQLQAPPKAAAVTMKSQKGRRA